MDHDWLTIYGAVIATIALCWNIYNIWRDRTSIKVLITFAIPTYQDRLGEQHITIEAINNGRHPITITSAGFHLSNNYNVFYTTEANTYSPTILPYRLNENEKVCFYFNIQVMKDSLRNTDAIIEYAWVEDAKGIRHKKNTTSLSYLDGLDQVSR